MSTNPHLVLQRLNTTEAAQLARRHRTTIHKALEAGELHGTQRVTGGRWSIAPACLEAWIDGTQCSHQVVQAVEAHARSA